MNLAAPVSENSDANIEYFFLTQKDFMLFAMACFLFANSIEKPGSSLFPV